MTTTDYDGHKIVVEGDNGSVWTYYAVAGPNIPPSETGWVLVIEGGPNSFPPQMLPVADVIGDLDSMMPGEQTTRELVDVFTTAMIDALDRQSHQLESKKRDPSVARGRARELRDELSQALIGTQDSP